MTDKEKRTGERNRDEREGLNRERSEGTRCAVRGGHGSERDFWGGMREEEEEPAAVKLGGGERRRQWRGKSRRE